MIVVLKRIYTARFCCRILMLTLREIQLMVSWSFLHAVLSKILETHDVISGQFFFFVVFCFHNYGLCLTP